MLVTMVSTHSYNSLFTQNNLLGDIERIDFSVIESKRKKYFSYKTPLRGIKKSDKGHWCGRRVDLGAYSN